MKTMYVAKGFVLYDDSPVKAVEVARDTEKCVWLRDSRGREERRMKFTEHDCWFDTYEEAAAHQRTKYQKKVLRAKARLEKAEKDLVEIEARL